MEGNRHNHNPLYGLHLQRCKPGKERAQAFCHKAFGSVLEAVNGFQDGSLVMVGGPGRIIKRPLSEAVFTNMIFRSL